MNNYLAKSQIMGSRNADGFLPTIKSRNTNVGYQKSHNTILVNSDSQNFLKNSVTAASSNVASNFIMAAQIKHSGENMGLDNSILTPTEAKTSGRNAEDAPSSGNRQNFLLRSQDIKK